MVSEKSVSFRSHLLGNTMDLLGGVGLHCARTANLVVSLVSHLAAYAEEGTKLSPAVYICSSISTLIAQAGSGEHILLSDKIPMDAAASRILKATAPLCSSNWNVFIERLDEGASCRFGVFYGSSDPSALTVDEAVLAGVDQTFPIIRIAQNVTNKVEVKTSAGSSVEFRFNDDADTPDVGNTTKITSLSDAACSDVKDNREAFLGFMTRLLSSSIKQSHGCLIVVLSSDDGKIPDELSDCIPLSTPLDLQLRHKLHIDEGRTAFSVSRLQAAFELVSGFVNSDGITILTSCGRVLAYRAFVKSDALGKPTGGARTRAYQALSLLVGKSLRAAFFRSQDGRMELKLEAKDAGHA